MGLALRRTELLVEAAQLIHLVQSLRGPTPLQQGVIPPYLTDQPTPRAVAPSLPVFSLQPARTAGTAN